MRKLIMGGGPWSDEERANILAYCESDVDALLRLLEAMLPALGASLRRFGHALLRGRYMAAAAVVENNGIPQSTTKEIAMRRDGLVARFNDFE